MLKEFGQTAILMGVEAKAAWAQNDAKAARQYLEKGLGMSVVGDLMFNRIAVELGRQMGDDAFLETVLQVALKNTPSDADIHHAAADFCYRKGRMSAARKHYEAAVNLKPRFVPAMRDLGVFYYETGEKDRAYRVLRRAREFDPKLGPALLEMGNVRYRARNYAGAAIIYELAAWLEPDLSPAYTNLGSAYRHNLKFRESRLALRRALIAQPTNTGGYYNLGNLEKETGHLTPSRAAFRRAAVSRPSLPIMFCQHETHAQGKEALPDI